MHEDTKAVVRRFVEEIQGNHRLDLVEEIFDQDFLDHAARDASSSRGRAAIEGFKAFYGGLLQAFPDLRVSIHDQIAEGDRVVTRKTFRGTHAGPLWGAAPTGKTIAVEIIDIFRIHNGRLAEHWAAVDYLDMARQLGIAPPGM